MYIHHKTGHTHFYVAKHASYVLTIVLHLVVMEQLYCLSQLSDMLYKLESKSKKYIEKIPLINNEDPFILKRTDLSIPGSITVTFTEVTF